MARNQTRGAGRGDTGGPCMPCLCMQSGQCRADALEMSKLKDDAIIR